MRVIGGKARGKSLKAPRGQNTRPITSMIKEALFNVLSHDIADSVWLDLFAGSGAVGIEAISRGASEVVFIDSDKTAVEIIRENLKKCGFESGCQVYRNDVFRALKVLQKRSQHFDYIYVDPPFTNEAIFIPVLKEIAQSGLLTANGCLILRTPRKFPAPDIIGAMAVHRLDNYGESTLHYYGYIKEGSMYWGSRGSNVVQLQQSLNSHGFWCGNADGVFGAKTYSAVIRFQRANGISTTGIVGPITRQALGISSTPANTSVSRGGSFTMVATGYCSCNKCNYPYGGQPAYNGQPLGYGIVAVDPSVIPMGTRLYIEGYGEAIAADQGNAIQGNRLDLCFTSHQKALDWGIKRVNVTIL